MKEEWEGEKNKGEKSKNPEEEKKSNDEENSKEASEPNGHYEGDYYHGKKGDAIKSASPENGQEALNNSLLVKRNRMQARE